MLSRTIGSDQAVIKIMESNNFDLVQASVGTGPPVPPSLATPGWATVRLEILNITNAIGAQVQNNQPSRMDNFDVTACVTITQTQDPRAYPDMNPAWAYAVTDVYEGADPLDVLTPLFPRSDVFGQDRPRVVVGGRKIIAHDWEMRINIIWNNVNGMGNGPYSREIYWWLYPRNSKPYGSKKPPIKPGMKTLIKLYSY